MGNAALEPMNADAPADDDPWYDECLKGSLISHRFVFHMDQRSVRTVHYLIESGLAMFSTGSREYYPPSRQQMFDDWDIVVMEESEGKYDVVDSIRELRSQVIGFSPIRAGILSGRIPDTTINLHVVSSATFSGWRMATNILRKPKGLLSHEKVRKVTERFIIAEHRQIRKIRKKLGPYPQADIDDPSNPLFDDVPF